MAESLLTIDCSIGGGQIARTAAAFACCLNRPVLLENVRASRPTPGLASQHIAGIKALAELFDAETEGLAIGSKTVAFAPRLVHPKQDKLRIDIPTAGSMGLVLQNLLLSSYAFEKPVEFSIHGGSTASKWSPTVSYVKHVLVPLAGIDADISVTRDGYYPKGGALVSAVIRPKPGCINRERKLSIQAPSQESFTRLSLSSHASLELKDAMVLERIKTSFCKSLVNQLGSAFELEKSCPAYSETYCTGCHALIYSTTPGSYFGFDVLGEIGIKSEVLGRTLFDRLNEFHGLMPLLDEHASDQIIPYIALEGGEALVRLTQHSIACISLVNAMLPEENRVTIKEKLFNGAGCRIAASGLKT